VAFVTCNGCGKAAGHAMYLTGTRGDIVIVGMGEAHFEELASIAPGDEISVDNSVYLAFQTMHRHQVDPDFEPWEQFTEGGRPIYPQRPRKIGPIMARQGSGVSQSGRFAGKMIVVHVPGTAAARRGPQAVVRATANGAERTDVVAGEPVRFEALIEVPPGAGGIIDVRWDFEGTGAFPQVDDGLDAALARYSSVVTHTFTDPGTYFPAVRVTNQRSVDAGSPHCRILNLGRVRVVVH
jgi:PKD domain